ncbi:methyltransferase domain-containing protein [Azospirillum sp. Marseille-Q6669]
MPTLEWMRKEFHYGYDSGNILAPEPDEQRRQEEERIGGSYREVFLSHVAPHLRPDSMVLELGPGRGSWTTALLSVLPNGCLHTVDFQDLRQWVDIPAFGGRLVHHQVADNDFGCLPDGAFDFFFSWGVLCHWAKGDIEQILARIRPKMKSGGKAVSGYAAWDKLDRYGWERGRVPLTFRDLPDDRMWWPRNTVAEMAEVCERAGWRVIAADLNAVQRDGVFLIETP